MRGLRGPANASLYQLGTGGEEQPEGARQGEAGNKPEIGGEFWRLAWLREKASLVVSAPPPPLLLGEPWKSPKPTSDGPDLSLSFFCPLDYNQLLRVSPQTPPPEFPKGRKLSKAAVQTGRECMRRGGQARLAGQGEGSHPPPNTNTPGGRSHWGRRDPNPEHRKLFRNHQGYPPMSLEPLQRGLGDSSDRPTQPQQPQ